MWGFFFSFSLAITGPRTVTCEVFRFRKGQLSDVKFQRGKVCSACASVSKTRENPPSCRSQMPFFGLNTIGGNLGQRSYRDEKVQWELEPGFAEFPGGTACHF